MYITEKNIRVADKIVGILISEECTVSEAQHILHSISEDIKASSTVQMKESYSSRFSDALKG